MTDFWLPHLGLYPAGVFPAVAPAPSDRAVAVGTLSRRC